MNLTVALKTILFVIIGVVAFVALAIAVTWARSMGASGWVLFVTPLIAVAIFAYRVRTKNAEQSDLLFKQTEAQRTEQEQFLIEFYKECEHDPLTVTYLGGSGAGLAVDCKYYLACQPLRLGVADKYTRKTYYIPYVEMIEVEVSGPGTVSSNAGVSGGGFGVEGFVKGALIATAINAATTRSNTNTYLRLMAGETELHFHSSDIEPSDLRRLLSPAFVKVEANRRLNQTRTSGVSEELSKLHALRKEGALSSEEFDAAKRRILDI